jgi:hydrogenase/urease accessory protein HupE
VEVAEPPSAWAVAWQYLELGVAHILLGFDHLLFVLALLLIVRGWRRVLATVTAFTLAHSITLAVATLGFVRVPGPLVDEHPPQRHRTNSGAIGACFGDRRSIGS